MKRIILISLVSLLSLSSFAKSGFHYGKSGGHSVNILGMNFNFAGHYSINGISKGLTALKQPAIRYHKNLKFNRGTPRQSFGSGETTLY